VRCVGLCSVVSGSCRGCASHAQWCRGWALQPPILLVGRKLSGSFVPGVKMVCGALCVCCLQQRMLALGHVMACFPLLPVHARLLWLAACAAGCQACCNRKGCWYPSDCPFDAVISSNLLAVRVLPPLIVDVFFQACICAGLCHSHIL
jgi:hypothetical protein